MIKSLGEIQICPLPLAWEILHNKLLAYSSANKKVERPPLPLVLEAWDQATDEEKLLRWLEFISWARKNNCQHIILSLNESDFYCTKRSDLM